MSSIEVKPNDFQQSSEEAKYGGRIVQENEVKLQEAIHRYEQLQLAYQQKLNERERTNLKFQKSQSQFLQIMREMIRFGQEFHDTQSIRSKLLNTKLISKQLQMLMTENAIVLSHEKNVLEMFRQKKNLLKQQCDDNMQVCDVVDNPVLISKQLQSKSILMT